MLPSRARMIEGSCTGALRSPSCASSLRATIGRSVSGEEVQQRAADDLRRRVPGQTREVAIAVSDRPVVPDDDHAGDVLFCDAAEFRLFLADPLLGALLRADIDHHPEGCLLAAESRRGAVNENIDRDAVLTQDGRTEFGKPFAARYLRHKPLGHCRLIPLGNELQHRLADNFGGLIAEHPREAGIHIGQRSVLGDDVEPRELLLQQSAKYRPRPR